MPGREAAVRQAAARRQPGGGDAGARAQRATRCTARTPPAASTAERPARGRGAERQQGAVRARAGRPARTTWRRRRSRRASQLRRVRWCASTARRPWCLPRSPGRFALSDAAERDAATVVFAGRRRAGAGRGGAAAPTALRQRRACLFPLAHTATLRVAVAARRRERAVEPAELPSAPSRSRRAGRRHSRGGARIEVPDRRLREAIAASTRFLLLDGARAARSRARSTSSGSRDEAARRLLAAADGRAGPRARRASAAHWSLTRDRGRRPRGRAGRGGAGRRAWRARTTPPTRRLGVAALPAIADLLDAAGEPRAAADVRALAARTGRPDRAPDVEALLATASPTWTWPRAATTSISPPTRRRSPRVRRPAGPGGRRTAWPSSPVVPDAWLGQGWEVHDLPTADGRLVLRDPLARRPAGAALGARAARRTSARRG